MSPDNQPSLFELIRLPALSDDGRPDASWTPQGLAMLKGLPYGRHEFWGVPFEITTALDDIRAPIEIALDGHGSHLVVLHTADAVWPAADSDRKPGQTIDVGKAIATYTLIDELGEESVQLIRLRHEIGEIAVWWGQLPFAARPHAEDRRHTGQPVHPTSFGQRLVGLTHAVYDVPWGEPASSWWLYALVNPHPSRRLAALRVEPRGAAALAIGAVSLFRGTAHPLRHNPARLVRFAANRSEESPDVSVDLGVIGRVMPLRPPGKGDRGTDVDQVVVEVASTQDATVVINGRRSNVLDLDVLDGRRHLVKFSVVDDATGKPLAARVNLRTLDGLSLPPQGHSTTVEDLWLLDPSPDVRVEDLPFAYVDGSFEALVPTTSAFVTAGHGFEYQPYAAQVDVSGSTAEIRLRRAFDRGQAWMTADTHVHVLSPHTALLEAEAEDVDLVNLLAAQWGDLFTNVGDFGSARALRRGRRSVVMGTENRQHHLGHILLLGTGPTPIYPLASGGPEESQIGDPVANLLADWAGRARSRRGLAVIPHFPEPYSECVTDAVLGLVDAVELRYLAAHGDSIDLDVWYSLLNVGLRLGCVAGTDKMSAATALGAVRTFARINGERPGFRAFAAAVKGGRTTASNGPFVTFTADDLEPGRTIDLPRGGRRVDLEVRVRSVVAVDRIQVIQNGRVVAESGDPTHLASTLVVNEPGWLAARALGESKALSDGFRGTVAAHTSPVYVTVEGQGAFDSTVADQLDAVMEGSILWLDTLASHISEAHHRRMVRRIGIARRRLRQRR